MSVMPRAIMRWYKGLAIWNGIRASISTDREAENAIRPTWTWSLGDPTDVFTEPAGSIHWNLAATTTEDSLWLNADGLINGWVKMSTLSDILLPVATDIVISGGVATLTGANQTIRGESTSADNLDNFAGMDDGEVAFLACGAEAITIRDAAVGSGNVSTSGNATIVLAAGDRFMVHRRGAVHDVWPLVVQAGMPVGLNALVRGSLIRGSAAGVAEALDLTGADEVPIGDGTDVGTMALPATGIVCKTAAGAAAGRTLTGPIAGITVADGDGVAGNPTLDLADDLAALEALDATPGLLAKTAADTYARRTVTAGSASLTVADGDGQAGNPTIDTVQDIQITAAPQFAAMLITGDLVVQGDSVMMDVEHIDVEANYIVQNTGYTTNVAVTGGRVVNYLPTATADDTVGAGVFVAGIDTASDPTITTQGAATFAQHDIVMLDGCEDEENDGLYEVHAHAGNILTLRSTDNGITDRVEAFTLDQITANAGDVGATITKVTVGVDRCGTDGRFEAASGAVTGLAFSDYQLASDIGTTLQAWDADLDALAALDATGGLLTKTGANAYERRTITGATNGGFDVTNGDGVAGNPTIQIDLDDLAAAVVDVTNDSIAIIDDGDSSSKKESIADFTAAQAGAGLTATAGVLSVDNSDSATATVTEDHPDVRDFSFSNPAAAAVGIVAQLAGDVDETTWGNITQPDVPRNIQVDFSGTWDGGNIEVSGITMEGTDGVVEIVANPGAVVESEVALSLIRRVRNLGSWGAGTADVETGPKLGVLTGTKLPALLEAYETSAGGRDAGATLSGKGLFVPSAVPDGARDYEGTYSLAGAYTDAGHVHAFT